MGKLARGAPESRGSPAGARAAHLRHIQLLHRGHLHRARHGRRRRAPSTLLRRRPPPPGLRAYRACSPRHAGADVPSDLSSLTGRGARRGHASARSGVAPRCLGDGDARGPAAPCSTRVATTAGSVSTAGACGDAPLPGSAGHAGSGKGRGGPRGRPSPAGPWTNRHLPSTPTPFLKWGWGGRANVLEGGSRGQPLLTCKGGCLA